MLLVRRPRSVLCALRLLNGCPIVEDSQQIVGLFRAQETVKYAEQADFLRLLDMLCRQYCAVSLSLNVTRSFDAVRMLVLGCMACVGDCILRMKASDRPSKFSLHYAGNVDGPAAAVQPFGFDMGYYALESEHACFTEPELTTARTQLLDYFHQQRKGLRDDHIIFKFEEGMALCEGDVALLNQLVLSTGYKRDSQPAEVCRGTWVPHAVASF